MISNGAEIVFDLNPPIYTNNTLNTLYDCDLASATITDLGSNTMMASTGMHYQWALNGTDIPDADQLVYEATASGDYTVTVTDSIGCTPTSAPYTLVYIGIQENGATVFNCYPDPFTDWTTIILPFQPTAGSKLSIVDA